MARKASWQDAIAKASAKAPKKTAKQILAQKEVKNAGERAKRAEKWEGVDIQPTLFGPSVPSKTSFSPTAITYGNGDAYGYGDTNTEDLSESIAKKDDPANNPRAINNDKSHRDALYAVADYLDDKVSKAKWWQESADWSSPKSNEEESHPADSLSKTGAKNVAEDAASADIKSKKVKQTDGRLYFDPNMLPGMEPSNEVVRRHRAIEGHINKAYEHLDNAANSHNGGFQEDARQHMAKANVSLQQAMAKIANGHYGIKLDAPTSTGGRAPGKLPAFVQDITNDYINSKTPGKGSALAPDRMARKVAPLPTKANTLSAATSTKNQVGEQEWMKMLQQSGAAKTSGVKFKDNFEEVKKEEEPKLSKEGHYIASPSDLDMEPEQAAKESSGPDVQKYDISTYSNDERTALAKQAAAHYLKIKNFEKMNDRSLPEEERGIPLSHEERVEAVKYHPTLLRDPLGYLRQNGLTPNPSFGAQPTTKRNAAFTEGRGA